ncbi:endonuclease/exonuclease/phosphatase family protein [Singulisphaera sp. PoT]|uniref:endonuclease/exonuclease/phosphatase family protein n=1 Tax=Singulisphaera sp. PoT TaxID=3411797 RepID=UPI003BF49BDE
MDEEPAAPDEPKPSAWRAWPSRLALALAIVVWSLWLLGQITRDRTWFLGLCFDAPSPIVGAACVGLGLRFWWRGLRRSAMTLGLLALAPIAMILAVENRWIQPTPPSFAGPTARLIHWNVGFNAGDEEAIQRVLTGADADLIVITEPTRFQVKQLAGEMGPGHSSLFLGPTHVIAKGVLRDRHCLANDGGLRVDSIRWRGDRGSLTLFIVDIKSDLGIARDPLLRRVRALMEAYQPDIVVGDFNSPRRSRALTPPPSGYAHAYEAAGSGWSYTWPMPIPTLAIDQCLVGPRAVPLRYRIVTSSYSDHRRQELDFGIKPQESTPKDAGWRFISPAPRQAPGS